MQNILSCISNEHDQRLLILAAVVCTVGVYGTSAIARHAGRCDGRVQRIWGTVSVVAAGCTAWATHMVGLLAFNPGMDSGFDPWLTALSLLAAILGIGAGVSLAVGRRDRGRRFLAGITLGCGVTALHYVGQAAYLVTGTVHWDYRLVLASVVLSLAMFGLSIVIAGERSRSVRRLGPPSLLASIAVLHFCGMTAASFTFDPERTLPVGTLAPSFIAPIVASVSLGLFALAIFGLRVTIAAALAAKRDRERLRELASLAVEGLAVCDDDVIASANTSLEEIVGVPQGALTNRCLTSLLPGLIIANCPEREERDAELVTSDAQFVPVRILHRSVIVGGRRQTIVAIRDQRERLRTETEIRTLAYTDALTGLSNRVRFNDLLTTHAAASRDRGTSFSVLLIDLDRFKLINDTLGHGVGDLVLNQVAQRLLAVAGGQAIVARLGGDEFAILTISDRLAGSPATLANAIVESIGQPFHVNGQRLMIGASVGTAVAPRDGAEPAQLLSRADLALYKAKADGKARHCAFEPAMEILAQGRREIELDLQNAVKNGSLEVHFQPLLDTRTRSVTGAEALVRWRHPKRGYVPPTEFIPIAEETGLIGELGRWVLRRACKEAASWPSAIRVAVNLSPVQFRDADLVGTVQDALAAAELPPDRLELEITEGVLIHDEVKTLTTLNAIRDLGVSLSLDDFGTGYSSLSYLRKFPFSKVKIDRSFVRNLPQDEESAAIIRAIVTLSACLKMSTLIEGVETGDQYNSAVEQGCDQIQGYLVSRPISPDAFRTFINQQSAIAA